MTTSATRQTEAQSGATRIGEPERILLILPTWVGDFVMATPLLRAIRLRFPDARITFLMEPNLRGLVRGEPWMDEAIEWPPRSRRRPWHREFRQLIRELRSRRFDWCVLLPNSFRSAMTARLSGARRRIGYDRDGRGWLLTDRLPPRNRHGKTFEPYPLVKYYADLGEALGCPRPDDRLELTSTPEGEQEAEDRLAKAGLLDRRPLVVLSPGAKYGSAKCWFPDRFAATADRLIDELGAVVIVTCGPGEEPIAHAIRDAMKREPAVFVQPLLSLTGLKSLVKRCDLLISNDAGVRHFAKAFGVPVVTIFGPTHREWTATDYPLERIVRIDVDCGPCQQRVCPLSGEDELKCLKGVTVGSVTMAAMELLRESRMRV